MKQSSPVSLMLQSKSDSTSQRLTLSPSGSSASTQIVMLLIGAVHKFSGYEVITGGLLPLQFPIVTLIITETHSPNWF